MIPALRYCVTSIVLRIVGEGKIPKLVYLLDHDVCTVILGVLQRWSNLLSPPEKAVIMTVVFVEELEVIWHLNISRSVDIGTDLII